MDLSELFATDDVVAMPVMHPTTDEPLTHNGKPVQVFLWGPDSPVMQETERKIANMAIAKATGARSPKRGQRLFLDPDELQAQRKLRLLAAIDRWENFYVGGKEFKVTDEHKQEIASGGPKWNWLKDQIETFLLDRGNFTTTPSTD